jgi:hypothetical protein
MIFFCDITHISQILRGHRNRLCIIYLVGKELKSFSLSLDDHDDTKNATANSTKSQIPKESTNPIQIPENITLPTYWRHPLWQFGKSRYFCVMDLSNQLWCEQHMLYTLMRVEPEEPLPGEPPLPLPVADRPEVKKGKSVHRNRG